MNARNRNVILIASAIGLCAATTALAGSQALRVTLSATGGGALQVGQGTHLTAAAKLPKGDHLVIQAFPDSGPVAKIKDCLRSPCTATYKSSEEQQVGFQASVIARVGGKATTLGRSTRANVFWSEPAPPPPPPPPPPLAAPGHYEGHTQDNEVFAFDVSADSTLITGLHTGQVNESCNPPGHIYGNNLNNWSGRIASDWSFAMGYDGPGTIGGNPAVYSIRVTGRFTASGVASGILRIDNTFTEDGVSYSCSSADVSWTANKV